MPRVQVLKCDKCDATGESVHTYRITDMADNRAYEVLACDEHAAPLLDLLSTAATGPKAKAKANRLAGGITDTRLLGLHADE